MENDFTFEENDEFSVIHDFYTKGDDVQKLSVIQNLPQLIQIDANATFNRIIPRIIQELPKASCEFHVATSRVFKLLMEKQLPLNLLVPILQGFEARDIIVANSWLETLLAVIPLLGEVQIKRDVLPLAQSKAMMNKSVFYRVASCKIFGRIAVHPKAQLFDVKKTILPLAQSLCQDYNYDVRAAMCSQLPYIAESLGEDVIKSSLMPNIVELVSDENMIVRSAAVLTVVMIIPLLSSETKVNTMIPLVKKMCVQSLDDGDYTFTTVSREFGRLLDSIQKDLTQEDCAWFLQFYKNLSQKGFAGKMNNSDSIEPSQGVVCRQQCAFNLPALTFFTTTYLSSHLNLWYSVFRELAADPCYLVRKTVAGCIHEIARILGVQCKLIKQDVVRLLRDDAEEVLQMLVPNLGTTLELFGAYGLLSRESPSHTTLEIGRAVLKCQMELSAGYNWRMQAHFMYQLERLPNCMPSDFIHQHFTPVVLNIAVQGRARPVRSQATRTLLIFLRYNIKEIQRKWIRDTLTSRLCYSSSCYTRHIYIRMCIHAMDIFSYKYFKEHFFLPLLGLADDPVSNIRLCVVSLLPLMRQMLQPEDRKLQQCIDTVLTKIEVSENNKDVLTAFRAKMREYKNLQDNTNERLNEERRRQEEENKVAEGKILGPCRKTSSLYNDAYSKLVQKTTSAPPQSVTQQRSAPSDMSFLEQHFYIDAGVALPQADFNTLESVTDGLAKLSLIPEIPCKAGDGVNEDIFCDKDNLMVVSMENHPQTLKEVLQKNASVPFNDTDHDNDNVKETDKELCCTGSLKKETTVASSNFKCDDQDNKGKIDKDCKSTNIETISTISIENTNIEGLCESDLKKLEHSTTNLTDDVKVNLRRIKSSKIPSITAKNEHEPKTNKRHSSIFSTSCLEKSNKTTNRRSLNIARDLSRIPVSFKSKSAISINSNTTKLMGESQNPDSKIRSADKHVKNQKCNKTTKKVCDNKGASRNSYKKDNASTSKDENELSVHASKIVNMPNSQASYQNVPKTNSKESVSKIASALPISVKRTQSETRSKK